MTPSAESGLLAMLFIGWGVGLLLGLGIYVWYAVALSRLFPRLGGEAWKGWVPILNEAEILARGGVAAWKVVFYLIPIVQIYGIYLKVIATHRINEQFGRGAGSTVLAILLPPVWASILAAGAPPYPEGDRLAALQPGPRRTPQPLLEPTTGDTRDYALPAFAPQRPASAHAGAAPTGGFIPAARPTNGDAEASAPAGIPAEWQAFAPAPQPPASAPQPPQAEPAQPAASQSSAPQTPAPQPHAPSFAPPTAFVEPASPAAPAAPPTAPAEEYALPDAFAPRPPAFTPPAPPAPPAAATDAPASVIPPVPLIATPPTADPAAPPVTRPAPEAITPEPDDLLGDDLAQTIIKPRQVAVDDDLEATVVVARKRGVRRSLVLDDGRSFALSGASVVIGRNPVGDPGEQRLSITDATRTLSKTHARLVVTDDEWRLTDLHATNGVVVVAEDGTEVLLDPGESVVGTGRFILGEVGMHVIAERDS
ncbi:DUF5684 domain-containing protein [Microbacterium sp. NPDC090003]|uniref:DUF5684 domain-containing protein n=1 Tax=Microbacterium sp. NPDC090003 TaxID=3364203 RepID=UPI003800C599